MYVKQVYKGSRPKEASVTFFSTAGSRCPGSSHSELQKSVWKALELLIYLIQKASQRTHPPQPQADTKKSTPGKSAVVVCGAVTVKNILEGQPVS